MKLSSRSHAVAPAISQRCGSRPSPYSESVARCPCVGESPSNGLLLGAHAVRITWTCRISLPLPLTLAMTSSASRACSGCSTVARFWLLFGGGTRPYKGFVSSGSPRGKCPSRTCLSAATSDPPLSAASGGASSGLGSSWRASRDRSCRESCSPKALRVARMARCAPCAEAKRTGVARP